MSTERFLSDEEQRLYIYDYPKSKTKPFGHPYNAAIDNLTVGDLHANAMKLIHILIDHGVADIDANNENDKVKIYKELADAYSTLDMETFYSLVDKHLIFSKTPPHICFIGDTLADRGQNDLFIIWLYESMHKAKIPFDVLLSNHDMGFLILYKQILSNPLESNKGGPYDQRINIGVDPASSLIRLGEAISEDEDLVEHINDVMEKCYLPNLKFIGYQYDENSKTFTLLSHAPVGLATLENLAKDLNITYDDSNATQLMKTIDTINSKFKSLYESDELFQLMNNPTKKTLNRVVWERVSEKPGQTYDVTDMIPHKNGMNFKYVSGHDTPYHLTSKQIPSHIISTDNVRGKITPSAEKDFLANPQSQGHQYSIANFKDNFESKGITKFSFDLLYKHFKQLENLMKRSPSLFEHSVVKIKQIIAEFRNELSNFPKEVQMEYVDKIAKMESKIQGIESEKTEKTEKTEKVETNKVLDKPEKRKRANDFISSINPQKTESLSKEKAPKKPGILARIFGRKKNG